MLGSWWFLWMTMMVLFFVPALGYGWGYRSWGPPYPRYLQRRRAQMIETSGAPGAFDPHAWGRGGDFVWMMVALGFFWAVWGMTWR